MKKAKEASTNHLLRAAREGRRWTQEEVAEKIGTTSVTISRWEGGTISPSRHSRDLLCKLFNKTARELGFVEDDSEAEIQSVFPFNEPLLQPGEMYGRRSERRTLIARTLHKASTSIVGDRRIGKTWLVKYLDLVAQNELGSRYRIGYLDATSPSCRTEAGFAAEALKKLGLPTNNANRGLISLDEGLQELVSKKQVPVLCIDEFEEFCRNRQEFAFDFFRGLRAMTQTSELVLVVVSKRPLHFIVGVDGETSGFFNIFEKVTLKHFDYSATEQFIREKSAKAGFTPLESDYLWEYGRWEDAKEGEKLWSPIRLQLAGKLLLEDTGQRKQDPQYKQSFEKHFQEKY